MSLLNSLLD